MRTTIPDYASYSLAELYDARQHISRVRFSDNYERLIAEIEKREALEETEVDVRSSARREHCEKVRQHSVLLLIIGIVELIFVVISPAIFTLGSSDWPAVACVARHEKRPYATHTQLAYEYEVEGTKYTGQRLSSMWSARRMHSWLSEYEDGKPMVCFVNPNNPEDSVLTWGWSGIWFFCLAHSTFMGFFSFHGLRNPEKISLNHKPIPE